MSVTMRHAVLTMIVRDLKGTPTGDETRFDVTTTTTKLHSFYCVHSKVRFFLGGSGSDRMSAEIQQQTEHHRPHK